MRISVKGFDREKFFRGLADNLGAEVSKCCREIQLNLPEETGAGRVLSFDFRNGLGLFLLNFRLKEDWEWEFQATPETPLFFNFLLGGSVELQLHTEKEIRRQQPLETLIIVQPKGGRQLIRFKASEETLMCCVRIHREDFLNYMQCSEEKLPPKLTALFSESALVETRSHACGHSLDVARIIKDLLSCDESGLFRETFMEAKTRELLSILFKCVLTPSVDVVLNMEDLHKIQHAGQILVHDLQCAPTIEELAKRSGINRQKLKQGFKQVFTKTINQYLRDERLETAKRLLKDGNQNVGDVADAVGYDNHSYFARLFKEKFGLLPGEYLKVIRRSQHGEGREVESEISDPNK